MDNFLLFGAPHFCEYQDDLASTRATCQELGAPLAEGNIVGPATAMCYAISGHPA